MHTTLDASRLALLTVALAAAPALAQQAPNRLIADQPESPFVVKMFVADPGSAAAPGRRAGGGTPDRVVFLAEGYNQAGRAVEAVEATFLAFDPFGEMIAMTTEMAVATVGPDGKGRVTASAMAPEADTYHGAVVFVRRVRLEGGSVWEADLRPVLETIEELAPGFDPSVLDE